MKIYNVNYYNNQSFKAIELTAEETKSAKNIIQNISGKKNNVSQKQELNLFRIFCKHIEKEAQLKSKKYYSYDEVISEMSLYYSEILKELEKNGGGLQTIISKLNEYKPSKNAIKPEYLHISLDETRSADDKNKNPLADYVTEKDLPVPESAEIQEKHRKTLTSLINSANITPVLKKRMTKLMNGKSEHAIAREEKVSFTTVVLSKKRATLEIQKKNSNIPKEIYDKAKEIKAELGLSSSEEVLVDCLIKQPAMLYLSTELIKKRFNAALSLLNCNRNDFEKVVISSFCILGKKTETLSKDIKSFAEVFNITEEQAIKLKLKNPYTFRTTTDRIKDNIEKVASIMGLTFDKIRENAIKQPRLLFFKPEGIIKRKNLRLYYNYLTNNKNTDFSLNSLYTTNYSRWYKVILAYIFTGEKILQNEIKGRENLIEFIKSLDKNCIYEYNLPDGESASEVINYAKQLSKKMLGKNVFKFNIVSDFETQKKQLAEFFGLSDEKITKFTEENPFILYSPIETINEHLQNFATSLNIKKNKALEAALNDTDILIYPAEVITKKIISAAEKLGGADNELIKKLIENPKFYRSKLDILCKKKAVKEYYCKLLNKENNKFDIYTIFSNTPIKNFYNGILAYIIAGKKGMPVSENTRNKDGITLTNIIKSMNEPVYEYNIPDGEFVEELIEHAGNLSIKIHGKNIFKFNVIKAEN